MLLALIMLLLAVGLIVFSTTRWQLHPFLALLAAALLFGLGSGMPMPLLVSALKEGFGGTIGNVGIIIIAGTAIGVFLERSGGAYAIAEAVLRRIGRQRVPASMSLIGYLTSIPVFADSGFVILQSLNRALTRRAGLSLATTSVAMARSASPSSVRRAAITGSLCLSTMRTFGCCSRKRLITVGNV